MTHVTYRLTAKNRDQLRNLTLGNRVWATFTFYLCIAPPLSELFRSHPKIVPFQRSYLLLLLPYYYYY